MTETNTKVVRRFRVDQAVFRTRDEPDEEEPEEEGEVTL
jgi:hypothetical protein